MRPVAMVGRGAELVELGDAWSRVVARAPAARTVVITGGAGLGKSLLLASALEAAGPRPATVLAGRARVHSPAPYDWLAGVLSGRDLAGLPVPPDALAWLAQHPDAPRERYAPGALLRLAVRTARALAPSPPVELTAREVEVLTCLAAGMSNKQVARTLSISIRTVGVHVSNLLRKTRSASRTEAALWAVRHLPRPEA